MLLKYFSNSTKSSDEITNANVDEIECDDNTKENQNQHETSTTSSKEDVVNEIDSSLLAVMDAINRSNSSHSNSYLNEEKSENTTSSKSNQESIGSKSINTETGSGLDDISASKKPCHQDIKSLLQNQNTNRPKFDNDDSDADADVLLDDNQAQIDNTASNTHATSSMKASKSSEKIVAYLSKVPDDLVIEDVDYVMCEQCKKKILCWNMPEHEDFHFAQMISRQMSSTGEKQQSGEQANLKKRSIDAVSSTNSTKNKQDIQIVSVKSGNSKKLKVDTAASASTSGGVSSNKSNLKSIDNYFKKINKN